MTSRLARRRAALLLAAPLSALPAQQPDAARIARVERGLRPAVVAAGDSGAPIAERMRAHAVPGVSVAVIDGGRIVWARAWGSADAGGGAAADTTTLFQAASISKPVTALAAMRLVARGTLALDEDIAPKLASWRLPPAPGGADAPRVTLRRLLSHRAGTSVGGFRGYAPGEPVPTLPQVLDGAPPANSEPVRVERTPGERWQYSGGGYTIVQLLLGDVTRTPFPALARDLVLAPLGMRRSTFEQPLPDSLVRQAAAGHGRDGAPIPGRRHVYPEMAAAGLWTTPSDLARFALEILRGSRGATALLPAALAREMLARVADGPHALGLESRGEGTATYLGHTGSNEGFRARLVLFPATGQGAVVMTNGDNGGRVIEEVIRAIAAEYRWPALGAATVATAPAPGPGASPSSGAALAGAYSFGPGELVLHLSRREGRWQLKLPWSGERELVATSDSTFTVKEDGASLLVRRIGAEAEVELREAGSTMPPIIGRREPR